jgi:glutaminyl-peptide cyclotransferase
MSKRSSPRAQKTQAQPARKPFPWLGLGILVVIIVAGVLLMQARNRPAPAPVAAQAASPASSIRWYGYDIVRTYPHDRKAFTQGLLYRDGFLYESTGLNGSSSLRQVELETGTVVRQVPVDREYFAEGLADTGSRLVQLTWQSGLGFLYDRPTFTQTGTFKYTGEGWGLTMHGNRLLMSDGSSTLRWLDPATLAQTGTLPVRESGGTVEGLNELESVKGEVFANVWQTDSIVIISPESGQVTGRINLRGLLSAEDMTQQVDVLNGIAYDAAHDRLFVTGKWWPKVFEIRLKPLQ